MIYTSYFAQLRKLPENIIPIAICGKSPDWYNGLEYKKLAPKWSFFSEWKENHDNNFYIANFNKLVLNKLTTKQVVSDLTFLLPLDIRLKLTQEIQNDKNYHIALICYEKPDEFCHRALVSAWLNKNGYKCEEWTK